MNASTKDKDGNTVQVQLSAYQEDIIRAKAANLERAMWEASQQQEYVYKPKFSFQKLMDEHPRVVIIGITPLSLLVVSVLMELFN